MIKTVLVLWIFFAGVIKPSNITASDQDRKMLNKVKVSKTTKHIPEKFCSFRSALSAQTVCLSYWNFTVTGEFQFFFLHIFPFPFFVEVN